MPTQLTRRHLFRLKPGDVVQLFRESRKTEPSGRPNHYFRPPGAIAPEEAFLSKCDRCGKCAQACPYGVIELLGAVAGLAEGTPALQPETNPCRWCPSMDCVHACPSGALRLGPGGEAAPVGQVTLRLETCLNSQGVLCDSCAVHCPTAVRAIRIVNRQPKLDADQCVGCGLCAYHCESSPSSLRMSAT